MEQEDSPHGSKIYKLAVMPALIFWVFYSVRYSFPLEIGRFLFIAYGAFYVPASLLLLKNSFQSLFENQIINRFSWFLYQAYSLMLIAMGVFMCVAVFLQSTKQINNLFFATGLSCAELK